MAQLDTDAWFILWQNHGLEGWKPVYCKSRAEVLSAIEQTFGGEYVVTKPLQILLDIPL